MKGVKIMNKKEILDIYIENCFLLDTIKNIGLLEITKNEETKNLIIRKLIKIENFLIEFEMEMKIDISNKIEEVHYMIDLLETGY